VAHDSLRSLAREDNRLDSDLIGCPAAQAPANAGVLALRVLTDADDVDLGRALADQRARDAGQQAHRAEIDVLVEALAQRQQQPPEADVVRHARITDRTEQDGREAAPLETG